MLQHLGLVALVMFILLMVAWTIDLAREFRGLRFGAEERGLPLMQVVLPYLAHRTADIATRLLPMAVFFGVFLSEILRRLRSETAILDAAGFTPLWQAAVLLWLGLALGGLQGLLEAQWRPAAVAAQVQSGFGHYGRHFRPGWRGQDDWFLSGDVILRGEVYRAPGPKMRNVVVFAGTDQPRLRAVYRAEALHPVPSAPFQWQLTGATAWPDGARSPAFHETLQIELGLVPQMLRFAGVDKFMLPGAALRAFDVLPVHNRPPEVRMALWRRRTAWAIPVVLAATAMVLARAGFEGRQAVIPRLIGLAAAGYVSVVFLNVGYAGGDLSVLPPWLASVTGLLVSAGLALLVAGRHRWRRLRARLRPSPLPDRADPCTSAP